MIDVRDIGKDFIPPTIPQAPIAPTAADAQMPISIPIQGPLTPVAPQDPRVSTGHLPLTPVQPLAPTAPSIPTGVSTQPVAPPATPEMGEFPYPEQWDWASEALRGIAETGMPGITPEYAETAWLPYQRRGQQEAMQAREQAGLGGLRWSTPLAGRLEDIWGGASERFGAGMERMRMEDIAGQRAARLGAAGGLGGLGGQYAQLPLTVAQSMMGLGGAQQQMQQAELDRQREEWLRQQPEYSPLLPYQGYGAQMPTGPSTYGPSFGSQMLDIGGQLGLAQMMGLFGGGGGGGIPTAPMGGGFRPAEWGYFQ